MRRNDFKRASFDRSGLTKWLHPENPLYDRIDMGHRPEVPRIGGALASRRYKPYHIKMSPPTGSVSTAATSHSLDNRLSFNDIITWDHKQWQQDPSFNVPQFLASLHEKKLGLFDESQVRIIDSVCSSMESQNTSSVQETSTALQWFGSPRRGWGRQ